MTTNLRNRYTEFCKLWLSVGSSATVDANRRVSAEGYAATMALYAAADAQAVRP